MSTAKPQQFQLGPVKCSTHGIPELLAAIKASRHLTPRRGLLINFINAHLFNLCWKNEALRTLINQSDIVAADGMAIVWAARLFGVRMPERCNMTDSFRAFLADQDQPPSTATLIGGNDEEVKKAARAIQDDGPRLRITNTISGFLPVEDYAAQLQGKSPADLILLGMGSPKSEQVAASLRTLWPDAVIWHIGGGTVMFFAGTLIEAPAWMRKSGLQWLHRLLSEPGRMWRRYVIGNPLFVLRVVWAATRNKQSRKVDLARKT